MTAAEELEAARRDYEANQHTAVPTPIREEYED